MIQAPLWMFFTNKPNALPAFGEIISEKIMIYSFNQ